MKKYILLAAVVFIATSAGIATARFGLGSATQDQIVERHAEILGLDPDLVKTELENGKTFRDIITESGLTKEEVSDHHKSFLIDRINEMLENGEITQEEADQKIERIENSQGKFFRHCPPHHQKDGQVEEQ